MNTKEKLIAKSLEVFSIHSFKDITVKTICEQCDISRNSFYNYFKDKYEYFQCCFEYYFEKVLKENDDKLNITSECKVNEVVLNFYFCINCLFQKFPGFSKATQFELVNFIVIQVIHKKTLEFVNEKLANIKFKYSAELIASILHSIIFMYFIDIKNSVPCKYSLQELVSFIGSVLNIVTK